MVNSTYIANATDIFDRMSRFSSETGYVFGHGIVFLVAFVAAYRAINSGMGSSGAAAYAGFWGFVACSSLWAAGWESGSAVVFSLSFLILVIVFIVVDRAT